MCVFICLYIYIYILLLYIYIYTFSLYISNYILCIIYILHILYRNIYVYCMHTPISLYPPYICVLYLWFPTFNGVASSTCPASGRAKPRDSSAGFNHGWQLYRSRSLWDSLVNSHTYIYIYICIYIYIYIYAHVSIFIYIYINHISTVGPECGYNNVMFTTHDWG